MTIKQKMHLLLVCLVGMIRFMKGVICMNKSRIDKEESYCFCTMIGREIHIKQAQASSIAHDATSSAPKEENNTNRKTGSDVALILEGNM